MQLYVPYAIDDCAGVYVSNVMCMQVPFPRKVRDKVTLYLDAVRMVNESVSQLQHFQKQV